MTGNPQSAPFGSILSETMAIAWYRDGAWSPMELCKTAPLQIHPAAHALHYGSACFEGFKAYRHADGSVHVRHTMPVCDGLVQAIPAVVSSLVKDAKWLRENIAMASSFGESHE